MKLSHCLFCCTCIISFSSLATPNPIQAQTSSEETIVSQVSQLVRTKAKTKKKASRRFTGDPTGSAGCIPGWNCDPWEPGYRR